MGYLIEALQTPRPSGFEEPVQRLNRGYITPHADEVRVDIHGNLIAKLAASAGRASGGEHAGEDGGDEAAGDARDAPTRRSPRLMFAGHCDQIGMLVSNIDDNGFVYAQTIGGWDPQQLIGQSMTIWTDRGTAAGTNDPVGVPAVISRKPIHLLSPSDRKRVVELDELWLDIGAASADDARQTVAIGDPVTLDLRARHLLDDKNQQSRNRQCRRHVDRDRGAAADRVGVRRRNRFAVRFVQRRDGPGGDRFAGRQNRRRIDSPRFGDRR